MHPILFELGNWPVYTYGVLLAAAYLLGLQLVERVSTCGDGQRPHLTTTNHLLGTGAA